ncbi:MAG: prepilin-type N-terminal cleavage/methylation domain-containing protein [Syntrophales bacterium]|nr:prepilin-type N-terminal cleavage/methylation domain-containing protein [Syntrophales bacterium]MDP3098353.1 prepilin-type N-terminal cleavage/methylation domain-containing protein [Syntrophales bacterium]
MLPGRKPAFEDLFFIEGELGRPAMWPAIINSTKPYMLSRRAGREGFTLIELLIAIMIIAILAGIAIGSFSVVKLSAYKVTLQHDLKNFIKAQEAYTSDHGRYLGAAGDFIKWGRPYSGTLAVPEFNFRPSEGVSVEIISGDGQDYMGTPPFIVTAKHEQSKIYYEYDFAVRKTTERQE